MDVRKLSRRYSICFSGVKQDRYHDGQMAVDYCYIINNCNQKIINKFHNASTDTPEVIDYKKLGPVTYGDIFNNNRFTMEGKKYTWKQFAPCVLNFQDEQREVVVSPWEGVYVKDKIRANNYSIYRREYEVFGQDNKLFDPKNTDDNKGWYELKGPWSPVIINSQIGEIRDFNIQNDKTYQYIIYPSDYLNGGAIENGSGLQLFANFDQTIFFNGQFDSQIGKTEYPYAARTGKPVAVHWEDWTIVELIPEENGKNIPIVKKTFRANLEQMWFFKYSLETGSLSQNISRNEFQTLGKYPKIGFGQSNFLSGDISVLLGSEIRPYRNDAYVERLWMNNGDTTTTTNERALMLKQWRDFVYSKNPKLLRDNKGQAWIVQIMSGTTSAKTTYRNQPDTISFQWKQVDSIDNVIIYGGIDSIPTSCGCDNTIGSQNRVIEKTPMFKNEKYINYINSKK